MKPAAAGLFALAALVVAGCSTPQPVASEPTVSAAQAAAWAACTLHVPATIQNMATDGALDSAYPVLDEALAEVYHSPVECPAVENNRYLNKDPLAARTARELENLQNRMCGYMRNVARDKRADYRETASELRLIADLLESDDAREEVTITNELQDIHQEQGLQGRLCWRWR